MSLVYVFTGDGKGKTSSALGMALRGICAGLKVAWVAWYKEPDWKVSEYKAPQILGKHFIMYVDGKGFYLNKALPSVITQVGEMKVAKTKVGAVVDKFKERAHWQAAQQALAHARLVISEQQHDLLICDELCQAMDEDLVEVEDVLKLIEQRGKTHLVFTGRKCPQQIIDIADTVTEMKKIKHAYDRGISAVAGLDF